MVSALLVPALAGFILLFGTNLFRYWLNRQGGYKLLFATAFAGGILLALSRAILVGGGEVWVPRWWEHYAPFEMSETVALSVLLAAVLAFLINCLCWKGFAARLVSRSSGDLIECLLEDSLVQNGLVELSMSNGKSYVGFPRDSGVTVTGGDADIAIVPLMSGYRHEARRTLEVTTQYAETLSDFVYEGGLTFDDFQVVLPLREVVSARRFDLDAYDSLRLPDIGLDVRGAARRGD